MIEWKVEWERMLMFSLVLMKWKNGCFTLMKEKSRIVEMGDYLRSVGFLVNGCWMLRLLGKVGDFRIE